jgi:energy-coupling factor transporter transmembrane protein EcfT
LSIGPILGGVLSEKLGWRWTFGFLSILSGVVWIIFLVAFPETCRNIVGNGNQTPRGINKNVLSLLSKPKSRNASKAPRIKLHHIPNPFPCLLIIFHKDTALILAINALFYVSYICLQASLSLLLATIYSLSGTNVGLCYLSYGIACALATYGTGKVVDRDYRKTAQAAGFTIDKVRGDDMAIFPIEKARLRSVFFYVVAAAATTAAYGWAMQRGVHLSVPLILLFFCALATTFVFNVRLPPLPLTVLRSWADKRVDLQYIDSRYLPLQNLNGERVGEYDTLQFRRNWRLGPAAGFGQNRNGLDIRDFRCVVGGYAADVGAGTAVWEGMEVGEDGGVSYLWL